MRVPVPPGAPAAAAPQDSATLDSAAFDSAAFDSAAFDTTALGGDHSAGAGHTTAAGQAYVDVLAAVPPRVLTYTALSLVLGAAAWRLWLLPRSAGGQPPRSREATDARAAVALAGALGATAGLVAAGWTLAAQLGSLGDTADAAGGSMLADLVWHTRWGRSWLAQTAAFTVAASAFWAARRPETRQSDAPAPRRRAWVVALAAGLAAAAFQGALGHAAAAGSSTPAALALAAVHVAAAALWLGTLAVMAGAWRLRAAPAPIAAQLVAFFPLALTAAAATAVAGAGNAWLRLAGAAGADGPPAGLGARLAELPGTAYGRLLLVKLAFAALVAAAGAVNAFGWGGGARRRAAAAGRTAPTLPVERLERTTRLELVVALVVFVLSAALAVSSPPGAE